MHRIVQIHAQEGYSLFLTFEDGVRGCVDLSALAGKGVFACWLDPDVFKSVQIGPSGELVWGDQVDLCPDSLYLKVTGKSVEELFPAVSHKPTHA